MSFNVNPYNNIMKIVNTRLLRTLLMTSYNTYIIVKENMCVIVKCSVYLENVTSFFVIHANE